MRIATFNVNGIKARLPALLDWLRRAEADVVCLQELKSLDANVPRAEIEDAGWNLETHGQKSFNGVAILSRRPIEDVSRGLPGDETDEQARYMEATVSGEGTALRVCALYLPNGNPAPGPKFDYKLAWMARLRARAAELLAAEEPAVLAGDFNVIPQPEDAATPGNWEDDALFLPETRAAFRRLLHQGWTDALRIHRPEPGVYSFWDYQGGAWRRDEGIRIDHLLLTPQAADRLSAAAVDAHVRGGEKPSDHVPVWCDLAL